MAKPFEMRDYRIYRMAAALQEQQTAALFYSYRVLLWLLYTRIVAQLSRSRHLDVVDS